VNLLTGIHFPKTTSGSNGSIYAIILAILIGEEVIAAKPSIAIKIVKSEN
jgi:hypothetical protein